MSCPAVLCRAVPCCAALCCAFSLSCSSDDNASKQTELARASMSSRILYRSVEPCFFPCLVGLVYVVPVYSNSSTAVVCTSMLSLSITTASTAKYSTAQHSTSAVTPAQSSKPSTCRSEDVSRVCTYMHAASGLFSWSMELLAFASRLLHRKCWTIYLLHLSVIPIHFFLVREVPCT